MALKIKTGDKVKITAGKDKGKEGKVIQVFPKLEKVVVEGLNMATRHLRSPRRDQPGQKIQFPVPVHISNVKLVSTKTGATGRVGYKTLEADGKSKKIRVVHSNGKVEDAE